MKGLGFRVFWGEGLGFKDLGSRASGFRVIGFSLRVRGEVLQNPGHGFSSPWGVPFPHSLLRTRQGWELIQRETLNP